MFEHLKSTYKNLKRILKKEVREGEKHLEEEVSSDKTLKDLRKRKKQVETSRLNSLKKNMQAKKAKRKHQHRMRSTPGEVDESEATPAHAKKEGKRWIQNTRRKTAASNKILNKKSQKRS